MTSARDIAVVGGGIIGASIAWHLAGAGAKVRLVTQNSGGVATPNSFAWINASWGNPEPYFRLRTRSMQLWQELAGILPNLTYARTGGLCWDLPPDDLQVFARDHGSWGYDIRQVSPDESAIIEPGVRQFPDIALHARDEGVAEPVAATLALIEAAKGRGVEVLSETTVIGLRQKGGKVVSIATTDGDIFADEIVLAAGVNVVELATTLGIDVPVEAPPGLIVHSKPVPKLLNGLVIATELHLRQTAEGRIIAGSDFAGTDPGTDPDGAARELFGRVQAFLKGGDQLEPEFHTVGYRPTPKDGFPILGRVEGLSGLYLAVTHSGITLAPAIGKFASDEILTGEDEPLLQPYRLSRFG